MKTGRTTLKGRSQRDEKDIRWNVGETSHFGVFHRAHGLGPGLQAFRELLAASRTPPNHPPSLSKRMPECALMPKLNLNALSLS